LETGGVCQRTPQVRPCRLCASIHAGETFAKHPRLPRPLTWCIPKAKTFETINNGSFQLFEYCKMAVLFISKIVPVEADFLNFSNALDLALNGH
jgi:hypothetical protein